MKDHCKVKPAREGTEDIIMKQKFFIEVQRISSRTYEIVADSMEKAKDMALDMACEESWACEEAEYVIE